MYCDFCIFLNRNKMYRNLLKYSSSAEWKCVLLSSKLRYEFDRFTETFVPLLFLPALENFISRSRFFSSNIRSSIECRKVFALKTLSEMFLCTLSIQWNTQNGRVQVTVGYTAEASDLLLRQDDVCSGSFRNFTEVHPNALVLPR